MYTYMTRAGFSKTFRDLSEETLVEVLEESLRVLRWLVYEEGDQKSNPASYMWRTYESALVIYGQLAGMELGTFRGVHNLFFWDFCTVGREMMHDKVFYYEHPPWMRDEDFIRSHRSTLMRLRPKEYKWAGTPKKMPLLWPVVEDDGSYVLKLSKSDKEAVRAGTLALPPAVRSRVVNA